MKTILDLMNIIHICFSVAENECMKKKGSFTEDDIGLFYHKLFDSLINTAKTYGNVIYANEGKGSLEWRRSIYPEYKMNRKHDEHYQILKNHLKEAEEIFSWFPCKVIGVKGAEGDDIMYSLATYFADEGEDVTVVSSDRDMVQLINYNSEKIKIYNPMTKTFREPQKDIILQKAIVGDASDGITGIPRVGIKTYQKMLENKALFEEKTAAYKEQLSNFIKIIDLSKAPEYIKSEAVLQYNNSDYNEFKPQEIEAFMLENGLKEQLSRWQSNLGDINLALYEGTLTETYTDKEIETAKLEDVESMLNFINNL